MKKKLLISFVALFGTLNAQDDIQSAVFENGREINYKLKSVDALDIPKLNVWISESNSRSTFSFGPSVSYSIPEYFISKFHIGLSAFGSIGRLSIENSVFFVKFRKEKSYGVTLTSERNGDVETKYRVPIKLNTLRQLGLRIGYLNGDYRGDSFHYINARANEFSIGLTYVNTKYYNFQMIGRNRNYQKMGRTSYYVELINYHAIKDLTKPNSNGNIVNSDVPTTPVTGYRIGLDGQIGGRFGFSYVFGFETPLNRNINFDVFLGVGVFLTFL